MNARIFKKKCKQAMAELIANHGFTEKQFAPCERGETWGYVKKFVARFPKHQRFSYRIAGDHHYIKLAKGTPLHSWRCSYEYDEWDIEPAVDTLDGILFWQSPEADKLMDEI